jgi:uncharacterized protein (DUF2336 family)
MSYFDRSTEALTSVENASLIDELISTIETGNVNEHLRILQRVTDLFMAGSRRYSGPQIALFDAVLQQLSADIEVKARAKLAHRLAGMDNAPPKVIRSLAFSDEIEVAGPVLTHSMQLSDADLVENAATKSQDHLFAIAQRLKLSEAVTDALVERGNSRVVNKVARNRGARFSLAGYGRLTVRARDDRKLMLSLARRSDMPRQYFLKLLENASASVRAKLEAINPQAAAAIRGTIDEVATAMQREARDTSREHSVAARDASHRFNCGPVTEANVHAPAHAQEFEKTVIALAKLGPFPIDLVERALLDEGSEIILLLAKAAGCSWVTAKELLQMYAAKRSLTPDDLAQAFERYKKLTQETARSIVQFHERRMQQRSQETAKVAAKQALGDEASAAPAPCVVSAAPCPAGVAA